MWYDGHANVYIVERKEKKMRLLLMRCGTLPEPYDCCHIRNFSRWDELPVISLLIMGCLGKSKVS